MGAVEKVEAVGARGTGEAIEVEDNARAGEVVRGGVAGARKSNIVKASAAAILATIQPLSLSYSNVRGSNRIETKLSDCLPPKSLGKCTQQHLCPLILDYHAALGDYSTDIVVHAAEELRGLHIFSTSDLGADILMITTCVDDVPGSTVGHPKRVQHLHPEYSPTSFHVSTHHDNRVSNIRAFNTAVLEHRNGLGARVVGTGEGGEDLVLV